MSQYVITFDTMIIDGTDGIFRFPMTGNDLGVCDLILKKITQTDLGITITTKLDWLLLADTQYQILIKTQLFKGMKIISAEYEDDEMIIALGTDDVGKVDKVYKSMGRKVGCLQIVAFL